MFHRIISIRCTGTERDPKVSSDRLNLRLVSARCNPPILRQLREVFPLSLSTDEVLITSIKIQRVKRSTESPWSACAEVGCCAATSVDFSEPGHGPAQESWPVRNGSLKNLFPTGSGPKRCVPTIIRPRGFHALFCESQRAMDKHAKTRRVYSRHCSSRGGASHSAPRVTIRYRNHNSWPRHCAAAQFYISTNKTCKK